ncbi:tctex1 domain-containing protein 1-like [Anopheles albimanus]|uniref:tctex1 domain-containing protein 1-like n=1 Tax=Anopheles albimanus TaxID=7167 RepID=UPI001641F187|nr:tctex1 domain-containing protein 1-like [Anopheles albimanus]
MANTNEPRTTMADMENSKKAKKIGFVEAEDSTENEKSKRPEKSYRNSTYPRESVSEATRKSSLSRLMGSAKFSFLAQKGLNDRTSMYMVPRFQNSYRLESKNSFHRTSMQSMMNQFLQSYLDDYKYASKRAKRLAENLSEELRNQFKRYPFDRYRYVAVINVGDKVSQDFKCVARALWDAEKDDCICFSYEAASFFVTASVWAIYYE